MSPADDAVAPPAYRLLLIVAGREARSRRAVERLQLLCSGRLRGIVAFEVVDIYQQPELAEQHQVVAVPTLLRLWPLPQRRVIGDLADQERILIGLDIVVPADARNAIG